MDNSNRYALPPYSQHHTNEIPSNNTPAQNPDYIPFNSNTDTTYETINNATGKQPSQTGYNPDQTGAPPPYSVQTGFYPTQTGFNSAQTGYNPAQTGYPGQLAGVDGSAWGSNPVNQQPTTIYVQAMVVPLTNPPPTYLIQSILNLIFCCWIFGIVAITKSVASDVAAKSGRREEAERESREARKWNIVGLVVGCFVWASLILTLILLAVLD